MTHGRVALVTGSSRGLGAEIARRLARDGFTVAVNGRPGDNGVAAVARTIQGDGGIAEGFGADVTAEDQVNGLVSAITSTFGPIDVLVLNATGPQPEAPVTEVGWADHAAQLDFFVKSPVLLGRAVLPGMQARRHRPRGELSRLRRRRLRHRPAHRGRRRPQPRHLTTSPQHEPRPQPQ